MKNYLLLPILTVVILALTGCSTTTNDDDSSSGSSTETYTVSGDVTKSGQNGTTVYLKLVDQGGHYTVLPVYGTTGVFSSGSASYSKSGIKKGTYTAWVFIDADGSSAGSDNPQPDSGELYDTTDITVDGNKTINVGETDWKTNP